MDAFTLGTLTGNLVMVLRMGTSNRELAETKLDVLDRLPVWTLGAVLNDVGKGSTYDYYRYSSYYLGGYEHQDEDAVRERKLLHRACERRLVGVNPNSILKLLDPVVRVSVGPGALQGDGGMDQ